MRKTRQGRNITPLKKEVHGERFNHVAIDVIGPFKTTPRGNTCVLVVTDYFSKWAEAFPMPDHKDETVATVLLYEWFLRYGAPTTLQTDGAPEFRSELLGCLCNMMELEKLTTLPYRPQSNGQAERFNRVLVEQLSCVTDYESTDWDLLVPCISHAYRATVHKSTMCTPNSVVFGTEIWEPADLVYGVNRGSLDFPCKVSFVENLRRLIREGHQFVRENLGVSAKHQKRDFDKRVRPKAFSPGDLVYRYFPPKANKKLGPKWDGPYVVLRNIGGTTYELKTTQGIVRWHVDYLKAAYGKDGLAQSVNLHKAPEYQRLLSQEKELLAFDKGKVIPGKHFPKDKLLEPRETIGVKRRGRPRNPTKKVSPETGRVPKQVPRNRKTPVKKNKGRRSDHRIIQPVRQSRRIRKPPDRLMLDL